MFFLFGSVEFFFQIRLAFVRAIQISSKFELQSSKKTKCLNWNFSQKYCVSRLPLVPDSNFTQTNTEPSDIVSKHSRLVQTTDVDIVFQQLNNKCVLCPLGDFHPY